MQLHRILNLLKHAHLTSSRVISFNIINNKLFHLHSVNNIAVSSDNKDKESAVKKFLTRTNFLNYLKIKLKVSGYLLYEAVVDNISYPDFFREYNLPDTFCSWFVITELHLWMLSVRAMAEGDDGRTVRNSMIDALWKDVENRVKKLGPANASDLKEQVKELSTQFYAALVGYDEGLLSNDDRILAGALWRRFFQKKCDSAQDLDALVRYVRIQVKSFEKLTREDMFINRTIRWPLKVRY